MEANLSRIGIRINPQISKIEMKESTLFSNQGVLMYEKMKDQLLIEAEKQNYQDLIDEILLYETTLSEVKELKYGKINLIQNRKI